jgi:gliding motility-associated-like protein
MHFKTHKQFMQKGAYALFCFFVSVCSFSQSIQNLINNPSAEQYTSCPTGGGQINKAIYWFLPTPFGSSDFFNTCATNTYITIPTNIFGTQTPRTGNSYLGLVAFGGVNTTGNIAKEYIGNSLKTTLKPNKTYCLNYHVSLAEASRYASANIGVYFSKDSVVYHTSSSPFPIVSPISFENSFVIADTLNWTKIEGTYLAIGNENFITIGNFHSEATTTTIQVKPLDPIPGNNAAYYYIDDVSVIEINPANAAIKDTLVSRCVSDSVILGTDSTEFASYTWSSTAAGLAALSCTNCPNPIAKPLITTKYYLTKVQCSATTKDSVTVVVLTPTTQANAGNSSTICEGDFVQLGVSDSASFVTYSWQGSVGSGSSLSCTNCAMPFANPNVTTTYTVQRTECTYVTTDTVKIIIDDCDPVFVLPNVFTPNADGINDTWGINFSTVNDHLTNFKMSIYDRWGLLVYSTNYDLSTPNSKWDGRTTAGIECKEGVYFYVITFDKNNEPQKLNGHLSLFR